MKPITYFSGDATDPVEVKGRKIIVHIVNTIGAWGRGFVLALSRRWKEPETEYRKWFETSGYKLSLGEVQFVKIEKELIVANMVGQESIGWRDGVPPIRYEAVDTCLKKVAAVAKKHGASVVGPRFGSSLAGGKWEEIEKLIIKNLCEQDIAVYIYEP